MVKKIKWDKKVLLESDVFKPSKAKKKAIIYKENDFGFISENQRFNIS